ncbi:MAG TPA: hypothetical protein VJC07_03370 [Candidatus Nanoarchaeia archaeon]|nr:hypothetical protein [Candidatus Nanoarchaeia archaeon]
MSDLEKRLQDAAEEGYRGMARSNGIAGTTICGIYFMATLPNPGYFLIAPLMAVSVAEIICKDDLFLKGINYLFSRIRRYKK